MFWIVLNFLAFGFPAAATNTVGFAFHESSRSLAEIIKLHRNQCLKNMSLDIKDFFNFGKHECCKNVQEHFLSSSTMKTGYFKNSVNKREVKQDCANSETASFECYKWNKWAKMREPLKGRDSENFPEIFSENGFSDSLENFRLTDKRQTDEKMSKASDAINFRLYSGVPDNLELKFDEEWTEVRPKMMQKSHIYVGTSVYPPYFQESRIIGVRSDPLKKTETNGENQIILRKLQNEFNVPSHATSSLSPAPKKYPKVYYLNPLSARLLQNESCKGIN